jgi:hypothetical protein
MNLKEVHTKGDFRAFYKVPEEIYKFNNFYRASENDITRLLVEGPSAFHQHATVHSYLILQMNEVVGRFTLIHDQKLPEYVQVSFFEAQPGLTGVSSLIVESAHKKFPLCSRIVIGLNGHLNYGAGILTGNFSEAPVFGLPYNREYVQDYFPEFRKIPMVSYKFPFDPFIEYHRKFSDTADFKGVTVRRLNKKKLRQETEIYTYLNNACFTSHPFWAERNVQEDFELFQPFRFLIREENLLFAEKDGKPIGFLLWYPDFNQLLNGQQHLGLKHVLQYYLASPIDTFRFTEIAVLPEYRSSHAVQAMILYAIPYVAKLGIKYGEGGFIFGENTNSIAMTTRFIERAAGIKMEPHRHYTLFESALNN